MAVNQSAQFSFDLVQLSYLDYLSELELERQKAIQQARKYHSGDHEIFLTERMEEFLGLHTDNDPRLNTCRSVITALTERLIVAGFETGEELEEGETERPVATWAWETWEDNEMGALQDDVHEAALRDGEAFVIVDWDTENKRPRFSFQPRFVSTEAEGDGYGCRMIYPDDNDALPAKFACKEWVETYYEDEERRTRRRRTLYFSDRVERWYYSDKGWAKYEGGDEGEQEEEDLERPAWPIPWKDKGGKGLGIPVIHFKNKGLRCEAWDAIPIQDAINKSFIDTMAAADLTAFRIFVATGFYPTTDGKEPKEDGSNWIKLAPGQIVGTTKAGADFKAIDGAKVDQLTGLTQQLIMWQAMVTDTPLSRFIATKQVAAEGTLKEQQEPLDAKAELRQESFGNAWEKVLRLALKLENLYGSGGLDPEVRFTTLWKKRRSLEELSKKKELGVPQETIWLEMGYSPEQIETMKQSPEYKARIAMMEMSLQNPAMSEGAGDDDDQDAGGGPFGKNNPPADEEDEK